MIKGAVELQQTISHLFDFAVIASLYLVIGDVRSRLILFGFHEFGCFHLCCSTMTSSVRGSQIIHIEVANKVEVLGFSDDCFLEETTVEEIPHPMVARTWSRA